MLTFELDYIENGRMIFWTIVKGENGENKVLKTTDLKILGINWLGCIWFVSELTTKGYCMFENGLFHVNYGGFMTSSH